MDHPQNLTENSLVFMQIYSIEYRIFLCITSYFLLLGKPGVGYVSNAGYTLLKNTFFIIMVKFLMLYITSKCVFLYLTDGGRHSARSITSPACGLRLRAIQQRCYIVSCGYVYIDESIDYNGLRTTTIHRVTPQGLNLMSGMHTSSLICAHA